MSSRLIEWLLGRDPWWVALNREPFYWPMQAPALPTDEPFTGEVPVELR